MSGLVGIHRSTERATPVPLAQCHVVPPTAIPPSRGSLLVSRMLGVDIPIIQAPMTYIAGAPLAAAVSNAGALGII